MTHRIVVNCETGAVTQVEYTPEEKAAHDASVVAQQAAALAEAQASASVPTQASEH